LPSGKSWPEVGNKIKDIVAKKKVLIPYCPNEEHKGKKIRLLHGSPENKLLYCPKCQKIYHPTGHAHMQPEPIWEVEN